LVQFVPSAGKGKEAREEWRREGREDEGGWKEDGRRRERGREGRREGGKEGREAREEGRKEGRRRREEGGRRDELNQRGSKQPLEDALKSNFGRLLSTPPLKISLVLSFLSTLILGFFRSLPSLHGFFCRLAG
jgi:hypothetical protein